MYHFFVPAGQISDTAVSITGSDVTHISRVLRMKAGDEITVLDGKGNEYTCRLTSFCDTAVEAEIIEKRPVSSELSSKLYLFQGVPKGDKLDRIVQESVELGVFEIIPVITERTVVKLEDKKNEQRTARYNSIAESAAKQAGRGRIPVVRKAVSWKEALKAAKELDVILFPYELADDMENTRSVLNSLDNTASIGIFIGPEGGFSAEEVEQAVNAGFEAVTLGKRILRMETAALVSAALVFHELETITPSGAAASSSARLQ